MQPSGYLCLVLHAHLPYVRHPETPCCLEQDWFFEAITESYVPILDMLLRLSQEGVPAKLTISLSPTLASMCEDDLLIARYNQHLDNLIRLADKEIQRTASQSEFHRLAQMYSEHFRWVQTTFWHRLGGDIIGTVRRLQEQGIVEVLASAATHGFLPLLTTQPEAAAAQMAVGVEAYRRWFGRSSSGFWLPECAYVPELDDLLAENGIRYIVGDTHALMHAVPRPRYGPYAPILTQAGTAVFGRDWESSKQVWSATEGYPGDFNYREFYRDIGYDLEWDYIGPHLSSGVRTNTGIKYYRITGPGHHKEPYVPERAFEKAREHAGNFVFNREHQVRHLSAHMDRPPIVVAPYDAELFGHWWWEGPIFLEEVLRRAARPQCPVRLITPSEYLATHPSAQVAVPSASTWGDKGYSEVWLNSRNDWIYRHLHAAARRMIALSTWYADTGAPGSLLPRALNQAGRELLLAQSSDWAFIMTTGTMVDYAVRRTKEHLGNFHELCDQIDRAHIDAGFLSALESKHALYPWLEFEQFRSRPDLALSVGNPYQPPTLARTWAAVPVS